MQASRNSLTVAGVAAAFILAAAFGLRFAPKGADRASPPRAGVYSREAPPALPDTPGGNQVSDTAPSSARTTTRAAEPARPAPSPVGPAKTGVDESALLHLPRETYSGRDMFEPPETDEEPLFGVPADDSAGQRLLPDGETPASSAASPGGNPPDGSAAGPDATGVAAPAAARVAQHARPATAETGGGGAETAAGSEPPAAGQAPAGDEPAADAPGELEKLAAVLNKEDEHFSMALIRTVVEGRNNGYLGSEELALAVVQSLSELGHEEAAAWLRGELDGRSPGSDSSTEYSEALVLALAVIGEASGLGAIERFADRLERDPAQAAAYADLLEKARALQLDPVDP